MSTSGVILVQCLAWGLRELGRIDRTLFMLEWLQSPDLRCLNKGEAKTALSRAVCFHRRGTFDDHRLRAGGLNLVVAAIAFWNTVYRLWRGRACTRSSVSEAFAMQPIWVISRR